MATSQVQNVSVQVLLARKCGETLILLCNVGNEQVVEKPKPLYLLPEGMAIRESGPPICVVPDSCTIVYVDVVESEVQHISGKTALELVISGPTDSGFHKRICC